MKENKYVYKEAKTSFGQIDKRQHELVTHVEFNKYINEFLTQGNHQDDALVEMYGVASEHETRLETAEDTLVNHTKQLVNHEMRVTKAEGTLVNHDNRITHNTNMNNAQDEVINNLNERLKVVEDNNADFKVVTVFANNVQKVETFVAQAGQRNFRLNLASYIPGQNRLAVYVNGVQQTINDGFVEVDSRTFQFTEGLAEGMKVTAHYFTEETSDDLTDIMETIKEGPAILEGLVEKAEKIKADSILVQDTKPLPEDNCDIWFDTSEDDFLTLNNTTMSSVEGVVLAYEIGKVVSKLSELATKGTTVEVLERATKTEIERQIADGTMANLTIEDNSITRKKLKDNSITPIKTTLFDKVSSKNLFDENDCVDGYYRSYSSGSVRENSNFFYTKNIELEQGDYTLSTKTGRNASCQICFLSESGEYVSGLNLTSSSEGQPTPTFSMPFNAKYACFSLPLNEKGTFQLEKGTVATDFVDHKVDFFLKTSYLSIEEVKKEIQKESSITVDSSMNLREIFSGLSNLTSEVTVYLKEGTYDTLSYYTPNEIAQSDFCGLFIPDNVRLVGLGNRENVILTATFDVKNINVSTINLAGTCHLENLTVIGNKTRYAIHDDFAELSTYENHYYRTIKNCVIKGTDTYYSVAYGSGTRSGAIWVVENTQFINLTGGYAFATHSRYDFELANDITFKNCDFITKSNYAIKVGGMESGVTNKLHFIGCRMNGIEIREEKVGSGSGIDYEIDGYGNSKDMLYLVTNTDDKTYSYCFSDESIKAFAYTNIAKGKPVQYANGSVSVMTGSNPCRFYGVSMQTVNKGDSCIVKRTGMIKSTDIGLEAVVGDKVVIQSGVFAVDNSSNDYIGRCTIDGYVKLQ